MKKYVLLAAVLLLQFPALYLMADDYEVNVTRKGRNIYKVTGKEIYIFTRYCYEYVYYSEAILKMQGYTGEIIFLDEDKKCEVKTVYGPAEIKPGTYKVTVTYQDEDWYEIVGMEAYLKISLCLRLSLGEEAILTIGTGGVGRIVFEEDEEYLVEGIFSRLKL